MLSIFTYRVEGLSHRISFVLKAGDWKRFIPSYVWKKSTKTLSTIKFPLVCYKTSFLKHCILYIPPSPLSFSSSLVNIQFKWSYPFLACDPAVCLSRYCWIYWWYGDCNNWIRKGICCVLAFSLLMSIICFVIFLLLCFSFSSLSISPYSVELGWDCLLSKRD